MKHLEAYLVPRESTTQSMGRKEPQIVIEGMEQIIERDLVKHKSLLERTKGEHLAYRNAKSHEINKKRHYAGLIGNGKWDDDALRSSMKDINKNIRHMEIKVEIAQRGIEHHTLIVDTLTEQLAQQYKGLKALREFNEEMGDAPSN